MGCTTSTEVYDDDADSFQEKQRANDAIDQLLSRPMADKHLLKLLLLGTGESGKSTVLKQMRLLHQKGFTHQERLQYAQVIWADLTQSIKILIIQLRLLGIKLDCDQEGSPLAVLKRNVLQYNALNDVDTGAAGGSEFLLDYVVKYSRKSQLKRRESSTGELASLPFTEDPKQIGNSSGNGDNEDEKILEETIEGLQDDTPIAPGTSVLKIASSGYSLTRLDVAQSIKELWTHDSGIKTCFARSNEFQIEGSCGYYFDKIMNFAEPNYVCSDEDILKGRIKTTGISETNFAISGTRFKVLDAGGQRSERSKWIHCFEGITLVLFVVAISEYNQKLFEDNSVNRLLELMHLFNQLCNSRWFYNTPFILFLNKMDIFEQKLPLSPIKKYFPQYQGSNNSQEVISFFENMFRSLNKTPKQIYIHRTCATDTQSMKFVLTAVTDMIVQQNLLKSGMI